MCEQCETTATKAWGRETLRRLWGVISNVFDRRTRVPRIQDRAYRRYLNHYARRADELAKQLANGDIDLQAWRNGMADEISSLHLTADISGAGGLSNYTQADMQRVQRKVDEQLSYLDNWTNELRNMDEYNPDAIRSRAMLYGGNATSTVQNAYTQALGIGDLPAYPGDGTTQCLTNCKCAWKPVKLPGEGNWDVYWDLGIAEHCPTCKAREAAWNPLQIRGGVIVTNTTSPSLWR